MPQRTRPAGAQKRRDAIRHPLQVRILAACNQGEVTPKEIADREGASLSTVGHHFLRLEKAGYLRVVRKEPARGFLRHFYVADRQAIITAAEFGLMSLKDQCGLTEAVLRDLLLSYKAAQAEKTLTARSNRHISFRLFLLDEEGWTGVMSDLDRLLEYSLEVRAACGARLRALDADAFPAIFAVAGFEGTPGQVPPDEPEAWDVLVGCSEALRAGIFDARADSHLSWSPILVDEQGWHDLTSPLPRVLDRCVEFQANSLLRLRHTGAEPIPTLLGLMCFEGAVNDSGFRHTDN